MVLTTTDGADKVLRMMLANSKCSVNTYHLNRIITLCVGSWEGEQQHRKSLRFPKLPHDMPAPVWKRCLPKWGLVFWCWGEGTVGESFLTMRLLRFVLVGCQSTIFEGTWMAACVTGVPRLPKAGQPAGIFLSPRELVQGEGQSQLP